MIQITIDEREPLGQFILSKAQKAGKSPQEIARQITQENFGTTIRDLHRRFLTGEFSQGNLADILGIERIDLIHILDEMGLPATNV